MYIYNSMDNSIVKIYKDSDFRIIETWTSDVHTGVPFIYHYLDAAGNCFCASYDGTNYKNCEFKDNQLMVYVNNPGFVPGRLSVIREFLLPDDNFEDGICNEKVKEVLNILLVDSKTDVTEYDTDVPVFYIKGKVQDVQMDGTSITDENGIANIDKLVVGDNINISVPERLKKHAQVILGGYGNVIGYDNFVNLNIGYTIGQDNQQGTHNWGLMSIGYRNYVDGYHTMAFGTDNIIKFVDGDNQANGSTAFGRNIVCTGQYCVGYGLANELVNNYESCIGSANLSETGKTFFSIGNGHVDAGPGIYENIKRHNLLWANHDGDLYIVEKTPTDDSSILYYEAPMKRLQTWLNEKADQSYIEGRRIKIGEDNKLTVDNNPSSTVSNEFIFGCQNSLNNINDAHVSVGIQNIITDANKGTAAFGLMNTITGGTQNSIHGIYNTANSLNYSSVGGYLNNVTGGAFNEVHGINNTVTRNDTNKSGYMVYGIANTATNSIMNGIIGFQNTIKEKSDYSIIYGTRNTLTGQYNSIYGYQNTVTGNQNVVLGIGCTISNNDIIGGGYFGTLKGYKSSGIGFRINTNNEFESAFGALNLSEADTYYSIGNGYRPSSSEEHRHNIISSNQNGDLYIVEKTPTDDSSILYYEAPMKRLQTWLNEKADQEKLDTEVEERKNSINEVQQSINNMPKFVTLTQTEYDALTTKDENTYYTIIEG